ncbi:MAG: GAF domain-containing protein [Desulfobacterales bacterium]
MKKHVIHYETLLRVTRAISESKDPEEVVLMTAESVKSALGVKGCSIFLINKKNDQLELAASFGLSEQYLKKGPVNYMQSIRESLEESPVAIYDVTDDPRIQYPDEAKEEGIASILAVPIIVHGKVIGALRVYTAEPWDFDLRDVNLVQAVSQICGMAIDACRLRKGYKTSIEILKNMRDPKELKSNLWTPFEGVPRSVDQSAFEQ